MGGILGPTPESSQGFIAISPARQKHGDPWWLLTLGLISLGAQAFWLGPRLGGDSGRYLEGAQRLAQGLELVDKQADFPAYAWLVQLTGATPEAPWLLVSLQAGLSILAGLVLYRAGREAFGRLAGLAAAALYLAWPDLQRWNLYLLTDGPFNSALAICLGLSLICEKRPLAWLGLLPALLALAFLRPDGTIFYLPLAAGLLAQRHPGQALSLLVLGAVIWLWRTPSPRAVADLMEQWRLGTVIWGHAPPLGGLGLEDSAFHGSLAGMLWRALVHDPFQVLGIMLQRAFWFLAHARPYYSTAHNLLAAGSSLLLLVLAIWGSITSLAGGRQRVAAWGLVLTQLCLVCLTWADWDGRFLTRVTPALLLLAADALLGQPDPDPNLGGSRRFLHL